MKTKLLPAQALRTHFACALFAALAFTARADVVLNGGGLALVEEGGTIAPGNLAVGKTAFAKDVYPHFLHTIPHLNDQLFGNSYSWIGNSADSFAGINLGATPLPVSSIAFGRDSTDVYTDRTLGVFTLQYTNVPNPDATTPDSSWTTIGTLDYQSAGGTNFAYPSRRHRYSFNPVNATGLRLLVPASACIDELEIYDQSPVVSNISAAQRTGTKLVDITYDVTADTPTVTVSVQVSSDSGATFTVPASTLSGAVGAGVPPGTGKVITWDAGTDWGGQYNPHVRFKVTAYKIPPTGFVVIPDGSFNMGDALDGISGAPVHTVSVSVFYMQTKLVTKAQWDEVRTWATTHGYTDLAAGAGKASNDPVQTVSWWDTVKYCNARSEMEGLTPCYTVGGSVMRTGTTAPTVDWTAIGYRLPTEAEWEKAARGGLSGKRFPWGNTITHSLANYYSSTSYAYDVSPTRGLHPIYGVNEPPNTSPVGSFAPNGYGLYDMAGNVWQWCWDMYSSSYYSTSPGTDPRGPSSGSYQVLRGGGWSNHAGDCRVAYRGYGINSATRDYYFGFRPARSSVLGAATGSAITHDVLVDTRSSVATLSSLTLGSGTLTPAFDSATTAYTASVPTTTTSITITPTVTDIAATVTVNDTPVTSGSASGAIALSVGANLITIIVTAQDTTTTKSYTVVVALPLVAQFTSAGAIPVTSDGYDATTKTVDLSLEFAPPPGTILTVVKNTGLDFIQGEFSNLAQGQTVVLPFNGARYRFVADYYGGTGNDLVLHWANQGAYHWGAGVLSPRSLDTSSVLAGKTVVQMEGGGGFFLALCADGTIAGQGANTSGQLGDGTTTNQFAPVAVNMTGALTGKTVVSVAAGDNHSLAVCSDGTVAAWGANNFGQLGNGTISTQSLVPVQVQFAGVMAGKKVVAVDAGSIYSLALFSDGTVAAWGSNSYGQLGDGTKIDKNQPVEVLRSGALSGKTVVGVSTMYLYCLALCSDGTAVSWGSGFIGQLANNDTKDSTEPVAVQITGKTVVGIAAGSWHSVFLCSDGAILTCGHNKLGELGDGTTADFTKIPVQVDSSGILSGRQVVAVASEWHSTLALCSDGKIASWGMNTSGQLGNGQTTNSNVPVWVDDTGDLNGKAVVSVAGGNGQGLAIAASPLSSNSSLSGLTVGSGTLNPAFEPGTISYSMELPWNVASLNITPTSADVWSSISVNGTTVESGVAAGPIPLSQGSNSIAIEVTAEDGSSTTYSIQVIREANNPPVFSGFTGSTAWQTAASVSCGKILAKATDADGDALSVTSAGPSSSGGGTAVLQGATILYTPATGFSGADTFPITITDARGASVEGVVTMNVAPPPDGGGQGGNPPRLTILPEGKIGIGFHGIPGRSYQIQRSTNLADWTPIATVPAAENGAVEFIDETPPEGSGFYRLRKP